MDGTVDLGARIVQGTFIGVEADKRKRDEQNDPESRAFKCVDPYVKSTATIRDRVRSCKDGNVDAAKGYEKVPTSRQECVNNCHTESDYRQDDLNVIPDVAFLNIVDNLSPEDAFSFARTRGRYRQLVNQKKNKICEQYLNDEAILDICWESNKASHRWCRETSNLCDKVFITNDEDLINLGGGKYQIPGGTVVVGFDDDIFWDFDRVQTRDDRVREIIVPDSVTKIMPRAFLTWRSLTSVTIPDSVTMIGEEAFAECTSLNTVTIPDSVTRIGERAFQDCTSLTTVTIPDSVTKIEKAAFGDCTSLTSVTIGNSVTVIGILAFQNCTRLASVTIPGSVTEIREGAFFHCENLTTVTIPDSVKNIGPHAFPQHTKIIFTLD